MKRRNITKKNKSKKSPPISPILTPVPSLQDSIKNLDIVMMYRPACNICKNVMREFIDMNIMDLIKLVNVDTEDWGQYMSLITLPSENIYLPIIISQKTKKFTTGYVTVSDLLDIN